jgi:hypothetical protein
MPKPTLKSERAHLKSVGAFAHPNSGRMQHGLKGDGSNDMFVIDVKEASKSFTVNESVWTKICTDAYKVDPYKNPQILLILGGSTKLAIIESNVLQELMEYKRKYDDSREH